jgi:hypothetical protein
MEIGRGNRRTGITTLGSPQIPHSLMCNELQAAAMGSWNQTARAMTQSQQEEGHIKISTLKRK